jgi:hypothetical protein
VSTGEPNSLRRRRRTATATEISTSIPQSGIESDQPEALRSIWCRSQK